MTWDSVDYGEVGAASFSNEEAPPAPISPPDNEATAMTAEVMQYISTARQEQSQKKQARTAERGLGLVR
jgi:hypothetical protein